MLNNMSNTKVKYNISSFYLICVFSQSEKTHIRWKEPEYVLDPFFSCNKYRSQSHPSYQTNNVANVLQIVK